MVNVQIWHCGYKKWESFGDMKIVDAAKKCILDRCEDDPEKWIVYSGDVYDLEARYEHTPEVVWRLTLQPRVVVDVVRSRGGN